MSAGRPSLGALCLALCLALTACPGPPPAATITPQAPHSPAPQLGVADLERLPQDPAWYLAQPGARPWTLDPSRQRELAQAFRERFFSPWQQEAPSQDAQEVRQDFLDFLATPGHGEDHWPRGQAWLQAMLDYAGLHGYPNRGYPGMSLGPADLRSLPTRRPLVDGFAHPGQGLAFDNLQQSLLPPNTPLYVVHASRDGAWLLCDSPHGTWWVEADKVARAEEPLRRAWQTAPLAALMADEVALRDGQGVFLFRGGVGTLLPLAGQGQEDLTVLAAVGQEGRAVARPVSLSRRQAQPWPLGLNDQAVARLATPLLGQAYGWGGSFGNRDCSALLKDLFTPFGLWLPRNSSNQAQEGGQFLPLGHLEPAQREREIIAKGVPYLTLVWRPGHIMLYIGVHEGQALVLHSLWGLKTRDHQGREGRQVVGRVVITSLRAGDELAHLARPEGLLLNRVEGLTLLAPPADLRWSVP